MTLSRRSFLTGLIAAPVIIKADSLMKVRSIEPFWIDWGPKLTFEQQCELLLKQALEEWQKIAEETVTNTVIYGQNGMILTSQPSGLIACQTVPPWSMLSQITNNDTDPT